jgi:hypothetical protein
MSKVTKQIIELAEMLGDPFGFAGETIDYIASELQISEDEVREEFDLLAQAE